MSKNQYITTTLPYVNSNPHIGFAMEIVRADAIARFKKEQGYDVFFNTGTDEHGVKIFENAEKEGIDTQEYVDGYAEKFKNLKDVLGLSDDIKFIRTTDEKHILAAQEFWKRCSDNGYIYKKTYQGKYCSGCELVKTDSELVDGKCEVHPTREIDLIDEENYFFKFSEFENRLKDLYEKNPTFVIPDFRFNEIKSFVNAGLEDFSISRLKEKMPWGIPVPGDDNHVMYVWFDALVNYISTLDWPEENSNFDKYWINGETVQYAGKDNLRQQSAMWQAMLMSVDIPTTNHIVIDGFITSEGKKMSKSTGNVISPEDIVNEFGKDAFRYYVLRELSPFEDSDFSLEGFRESYNAHLANGIGNLTNRILKMSETHIPDGVEIVENDLSEEYIESFKEFNLQKVCNVIWKKIGDMDKYIQDTEPFKLVKEDLGAAKIIIESLAQDLYDVAVMLKPILPETSEKILISIKENKKPEIGLFDRK